MMALSLLLLVQNLDQLPLRRVIELRPEMEHVQGIDVQGRTLWITAVDTRTRRGYLDKISLGTGNRLARVEVTDGERFHPGGIALDGDSIWVPVAENRRDSTAVLQRRDKRTLQLQSSFRVADHIGCVAAARDRLYGGNWDSREIYEWDRAGRQLRQRPNPQANHYQDLKFTKGLLVASGVLSRDQGAIDWLDPATLRLARRIDAGKTDRGVLYTNEGMTLGGGLLFLAPEDGRTRVFVYQAPRVKLKQSGQAHPQGTQDRPVQKGSRAHRRLHEPAPPGGHPLR